MRTGSWLLWMSLASLAVGATGCATRHATVRMQPGEPLEIRRGFCLNETQFKQRGQHLKRDEVMERLSKNRASVPSLRAGHRYAVASIVASIAALPLAMSSTLGRYDAIETSPGVDNALLASSLAVVMASWVLCITSDGKYVQAAEIYNSGLVESGPGFEQLETWE